MTGLGVPDGAANPIRLDISIHTVDMDIKQVPSDRIGQQIAD
jgi:hypothetical protein